MTLSTADLPPATESTDITYQLSTRVRGCNRTRMIEQTPALFRGLRAVIRALEQESGVPLSFQGVPTDGHADYVWCGFTNHTLTPHTDPDSERHQLAPREAWRVSLTDMQAIWMQGLLGNPPSRSHPVYPAFVAAGRRAEARRRWAVRHGQACPPPVHPVPLRLGR